MTKINDIKGLADKHQLEEMEFNIISVDKEEDGQYGKNYSCSVSDDTGKTFCKFGSIKDHDVRGWVGKRVNFKSTRNKQGQLISIRVDKKGIYSNLYITNSVKASVVGESTSAPPSGPGPAIPPPRPKPDIPPNLLAKRIAEEWCAVHAWTKDVFEPVVGVGNARECVTSVWIQLNRMGVQILPPIEPPKKPWREVVFKDSALGTWEPERIRKALIKVYQGTKASDEVMTALFDAAEEPEFSDANCFVQMITDAGVDEDDINAVIKEKYSGLTVRELIGVGREIIEEAQRLAASKPSDIDNIDF